MPDSVLECVSGAFDGVGSLAVMNDVEGGLLTGSSSSESKVSSAAGFVRAVTKEEMLTLVGFLMSKRSLKRVLGFDFVGLLGRRLGEIEDSTSGLFRRLPLLPGEEASNSSSSSSSSSISSGCGKLEP